MAPIKKVSYLDVLVESKVDAIICVGSTYKEKRFYEKLKNMSVIIPMALLNVKTTDENEKIVNIYDEETQTNIVLEAKLVEKESDFMGIKYKKLLFRKANIRSRKIWRNDHDKFY